MSASSKDASKKKFPLWLWLPRLLAAAILAMAAYQKLVGAPVEMALFTELGMEPTGRLLIGVIEASCALLLLSPYSAVGAVLSSAVMTGALIAHATKIGFTIDGDPSIMAAWAVVMTCSLLVVYVRRSELPLIGDTL